MEHALDFNIFNIFIISASIHGLIFGLIVLFSKKFKTKPNRYLASYILLVSLNNIYFWFIDTNIYKHFDWAYYGLFPIQWDLLMFPAFFYFISSYLGHKKQSQLYMYPFYVTLPFCVFFLVQQIWFSDWLSKTVISQFYLGLSFVSMICTAIAIFKGYKLILNYQKNVTIKSKIETQWLKRLLQMAIVVFLIWVSISVFNNWIYKNVEMERITTYVLWISMSLLIYWMGYLGVYHLGIFNQRTQVRKALESTMDLSANGDAKHQKRFEDIDIIIKAEKLYLNPNLSLQSLAERFELSEGYLSQIVNSNVNSNFSDYINVLRIENAKTILINPSYKPYTIVAIALESGFNSKSTFYNAFKKHVGESPSMYRKTNMS